MVCSKSYFFLHIYHIWDMFNLKYICLWFIKMFVSLRVQREERSSSLEIHEDRLVTRTMGTYIHRYWTNSKVLDSIYCKPQYQITLKRDKYFQFQHARKQTVHPNYVLIFCMTYSDRCLKELCSHFFKRNTCLILGWTFYDSLSNTQIIWWLWMKKGGPEGIRRGLQ